MLISWTLLRNPIPLPSWLSQKLGFGKLSELCAKVNSAQKTGYIWEVFLVGSLGICSLLCMEILRYWRSFRWRERMKKECRREEIGVSSPTLSTRGKAFRNCLPLDCKWHIWMSQLINSHAQLTKWQSETKIRDPWEQELCLKDWWLGERKMKKWASKTWRKTTLTGLLKWGLQILLEENGYWGRKSQETDDGQKVPQNNLLLGAYKVISRSTQT